MVIAPPRLIRLRRPATLSLQEGVFVPGGDARVKDEMERRWTALCASNAAYFDGRLCHVLGVNRNGHGGAVIHVIDCAYRFWAVQDETFDVGVRPLGVKGLTIDHSGRFLMGLRSAHVAAYKNMWEFAPGGSVEPGVAPADIVREELREETGLECSGEPVAAAVLFDPGLRCWELVFRLTPRPGALKPRANEYPALEWRGIDDLPAPLSPIAQQMLPIARELVGADAGPS